MKLEVLRLSRWEHPGEFPTFAKGTAVALADEEDTEFLGWHECTIAGHETFAPKVFVCDGKLTRDYNPTELIQKVGDVLELQEIVGAWLIAKNENGVTGWIPAECVKSVG
ncbi:MAG: SH3 domain-containing protein [Defluviitaleaceae bacterium]|nr:SH3 domain-containing protein [Defluviitaleaceae bacterium]MCL2263573.1 SH3 domain-containing protein [Defluviitaleaceae bacterium]